MKIHGIKCNLKTKLGRQAVADVLAQIEQRKPKDLERLQSRITAIEPMDDPGDGTGGEYKDDPVEHEIGKALDWGLGYDNPCTVYIVEGGELWKLTAVVAHELGHVCTTFDDLERRGGGPDEWCGEMAADWYAYRWGFGRLIARDRQTRNYMHHGPAPGTEFEEQMDNKVIRYKVTRNFCIRQIGESQP